MDGNINLIFLNLSKNLWFLFRRRFFKMLVGFFFNITILYSIYGYSYVYKKYILDDNDSLKNIDFFGLFFIYLLSLIFNFFLEYQFLFGQFILLD